MEQDDGETKRDSGEPQESDEPRRDDNVVFGRFGPRSSGGEVAPPPPGKAEGDTEEDTPAGEAIREWWRHLDR
jgi:hypothetical protein